MVRFMHQHRLLAVITERPQKAACCSVLLTPETVPLLFFLPGGSHGPPLAQAMLARRSRRHAPLTCSSSHPTEKFKVTS